MLSQRYEYDKKESVKLNQLQIETRNNILAKINSQKYRMEEVKCICGNDSFEVLAEKDKYGLPIRFVVCKSCGLILINSRMNQESYDEFYRKEYRKLYNNETIPFKYFLFQVKRGEYINEYLNKTVKLLKGKVLEIGCGAGGILETFKKRGWEVTGIDLGAEYLEYGKNRGLDLITGNSKNLVDTYFKSFDLVILSHVFEHFLDLGNELSVIYQLLKDDGLLYIEVPGIKTSRYDNSNFINHLHIAHTYYFSLDTLTQVLNHNGFILVNGNEDIQSVFKKSSIIYSGFSNYYQDVINHLYNLERKWEFNCSKLEFFELKRKIQRYPEKSVVLYGTGNHTRMLLSFLGDEKRIYCLTDQDSSKFGQTYMGYPIYDLNEIEGHIKAIVISSTVYQEMIYQRIKHMINHKIDILKIYNEDDFYKG